MLKGMRNAGQTWIGKTVITIMFGFLIVSFAVWGIGPIFQTVRRGPVAKVGDIEISSDEVRNAYQTDVQRLSRQLRQPITPERARALGLDNQVLSRLVTEAVLDQRARDMGLAVSDALVVQDVMDNPAFKGPNGQFDRARFEELLRDNGLGEAGFVAEQRQALARQQIAEAITGTLPVPLAMREAMHRYGAARRAASYIALPPSAAGDIPAPTDEQLKSFYEAHKAEFRAPEYRTVNALVLEPSALAKPDEVSDEEARKRYESVKASRYGTPEKRTIQQIVFPTEDEAKAAAARIAQGTPFETIATERNIAPKDLEIGTFTKPEIYDQGVADAAFSLAEGAVSAPVKTPFGAALVRVERIEPASTKPFEEVAPEIKREIALEQARNHIDAVHDAIEDQRAGAKPLADIAKDKSLPLVAIAAVDRNGLDPSGNPVAGLPEKDTVLKAAFASDIGLDNEPVRLKDGGYVWYDVTRIDPAHDRPLAEVHDKVAQQWREDEIAQKLAEKARGLAERLDKGETLEAVAQELGLEVKQVTDLARSGSKDGLAPDAVARIFATPVGKAASAASGDGRVVFKVTSATVPPFVTTTQQAQKIEDQLRTMLSDDLLTQYIAEAQKEIGVTVNDTMFRQAIGGGAGDF